MASKQGVSPHISCRQALLHSASCLQGCNEHSKKSLFDMQKQLSQEPHYTKTDYQNPVTSLIQDNQTQS